VGNHVDVATRNARALQRLEVTLHSNVEVALNRLLVGHDAVIAPAVIVYRLHYVVLLGVLLWLFVRHAESYLSARRALVAMLGLGLLAYWAVPMSPPRFALPRIVDVVAEHDLLGGRLFHEAGSYTAMPSLHVAWSAWAAFYVWCALRDAHPRLALLAWAFPVAMVAVVLATGRHYVLDVVGSAVLLAASIAAAHGWARLALRRDRARAER